MGMELRDFRRRTGQGLLSSRAFTDSSACPATFHSENVRKDIDTICHNTGSAVVTGKLPKRIMTESGNHSGTQGDLLRPLTREPDGRERALLEETLEAVREIRDLVREPATPPDDRIPASLRNLESRLDALPESLSGRLRQVMEEIPGHRGAGGEVD